MDNKRKLIFLFITLAALLAACVAFFFLARANIDTNPSPTVISADGPITIYVMPASPFTRMYRVFVSLMFIAADLAIVAAIKIVETISNHKLKRRYAALILVLFNLAVGILLMPTAIFISIALSIVIIIVFVVKYHISRRLNRHSANGTG